MIEQELEAAFQAQTITIVNLADLIRDLTWSLDVSGSRDIWGSDDQWFAKIVVDKWADSCMGYLIDSILNYGFTVPLNVIRRVDMMCDDCFANSDEDCTCEVAYGMGNGHHRLIAAALCGIEWIPVVVSSERCDWDRTTDENDDSYYYGEFVETAQTDALQDEYWESLNDFSAAALDSMKVGV